MIVKVKTTNIGDVASKLRKKEKRFGATMVEDKSQTRIDDAVKKAKTTRVELKLLKEELLLPVSKRTESLFKKYGKLVAEEPVAVKIGLLEELSDDKLVEVVDEIKGKPKEDVEEEVEEEEVSVEVSTALDNWTRKNNDPKTEMISTQIIDKERKLPDHGIVFQTSKDIKVGANVLKVMPKLLQVYNGKYYPQVMIRVLVDPHNYIIIAYLGSNKSLSWDKLKQIVYKVNFDILKGNIENALDNKRFAAFMKNLK